jgi:hypothetical protein
MRDSAQRIALTLHNVDEPFAAKNVYTPSRPVIKQIVCISNHRDRT